MAAIPAGKWLFVWQFRNIPEPDIFADKCVELGLSGVSIKVANGIYKYSYNEPRLREYAEILRAHGLKVGGWHYVYGNDPLAEASRVIERIHAYNLDCYEIDAEGDYKHKFSQATQFMRALRIEFPEYPFGLTSYRYPSYHPEFPWKEFCAMVSYHVPQVYWNPPSPPNYGPIPELNKSYTEIKKIKDLPFLPAGRAYIGDGHPDPKPEELTAFMGRCSQLELRGFTFWAADFLYLHAGGALRAEAIKKFVWNEPPPPPPCPYREAEVIAVNGVNIRRLPDENSQVWFAIPYGTRLTVLEEITKPDGDIWVRVGEQQYCAYFYNGYSYIKYIQG